MTNLKKNNRLSLSIKIVSKLNDSYSASITTEAEFNKNKNRLLIEEKAPSFVDLRARWNTIMRGLIASDQVLISVNNEEG